MKERDLNMYFDELPKDLQDMVRELILEAAENRNGPEGFKTDDECIESVECRSRAGFIPFSHNKGGLTYRNFATHMDYFAGGYDIAHKKAHEKLREMMEQSIADTYGYFFDDNKELLESHGFKRETFSYGELQDKANLGSPLYDVLNDLGNAESESLSDENSTVMHEFRFMYEGQDEDGVHSASVSAAINLEAPYHRSSISWMPGVFCEGASEVEIEWKTKAELKNKLKIALSKVSADIF